MLCCFYVIIDHNWLLHLAKKIWAGIKSSLKKTGELIKKKRRVDKRVYIIFKYLHGFVGVCVNSDLACTQACTHTHLQTHKHICRSIWPCRHQEWWMCIFIPGLWWIKDESSVYTAFYLTWNIYTFSYCKDEQVPQEIQVKETPESNLYDLQLSLSFLSSLPSALSLYLSLPGIINHLRRMFTQSDSLRKSLRGENSNALPQHKHRWAGEMRRRSLTRGCMGEFIPTCFIHF